MSIHLPRLKAIIQDLHGMEVIDVFLEDRITDLGLDSLDREELSLVVEDEFDVKIHSEDLRRLTSDGATVKDWTDYLEKKI